MKKLKEKINLEDNVLGFVFYGLIFISIGLGILLKTLTNLTLSSGIFLMVIGFISLIIGMIIKKELYTIRFKIYLKRIDPLSFFLFALFTIALTIKGVIDITTMGIISLILLISFFPLNIKKRKAFKIIKNKSGFEK